MNELFRRLHYLWNRRRLDRELANDMEFHREMTGHGGPEFGNMLRLREEAREAWGWTWIDRLCQDVKYAARLLRRSPGFTLAAVLILAIGIGVNVAAFGFFDLMVLRPLPVRDPATLVRFQRLSPQGYASVLPYPEMDFFRQRTTTLSAVLAWAPATLVLDREEKSVNAQFVTANFMTELGATARVGRLLDPSRDDTAGADPVAILSYGFWERQFAGDPSVVGRTIHLNGKPVTIAGVAGREFSGLSLDSPELWLPIAFQPRLVEGSKLLTDYAVAGAGVTVWGRLRPGVTPKAAEAELRSLAAALRPSHPNDIWENETLPASAGAYASSAINSGHHGTGTRGPNPLVPAAAAIGALVLLILAAACANLGSLLMARGFAREREIAIRMAVGAGKGRLVRQLFTESVLLALLGSAAGLGLGDIVLRALLSMSGSPAWLDPSPDWRVVVFAGAMAFAAAILFGLTPAFQVIRQRHRATFARHVLIGAQVAASCVLLIVAGLLVRALNQASDDPGLDYRQMVTIDPALGNHGYAPEMARSYLEALRSRVAELPGVQSVAFSTTPPFGRKTVTVGMELRGRPLQVLTNSVDSEYFRTVRIPLLRGRAPMRGDSRTVVVSQRLALFAWPGEDPIGKPFDLGGTTYTVVGVCGNATVNPNGGGAEAYPIVAASEMPNVAIVVHTAGRPEDLAAALTPIARAADPKVRADIQLMKSGFERRLHGKVQSALAVGLLAVVSLLLACLGIVGLVSFAVSQRTKEIGIRMALGAQPAQILSIALRQLSRPVLVGLLIGAGGAGAVSLLLRQVLFGVGTLDPVAYVGAIGLFILTAAGASLFPARRALRVDPVTALRND